MKRLAVLFALLMLAAGCDIRSMFMSPPSGTIVDTSTVTVTGTLPEGAEPGGTVVVNGVTGTWSSPTEWSAVIPVDTGTYVTPVTTRYTAPGGLTYIQESTLVYGPKVDDGEYSPDGVGMLFTNNGLAGLGPVINSLASSSFSIASMIPPGTLLVSNVDAGSGVTITEGRSYEAGAESVSLSTTSTSTGVSTPITVTNLYLGMTLQLSGLISGTCKLEIQIPTTSIGSKFDLAPAPGAPDTVDVNMIGAPTVTPTGLSYEFISGPCDPSTPLLGSIINSAASSAIQGSISSGFVSKLQDPDGSGPADSPIADAIETALNNISIAGSVGGAVKANLDAPFTQITETASAIDFRSNADFYTTFGAGPTDCQPPANAPDFQSSFDIAGTYPSLGATTPTGGVPYGLGLVISSSTFNQLLSSMTECGLLNQEMTEITLGATVLPVTSSVLSLLVPQFGDTTKIPAGTPMKIRIDPQAAPFLTSAPAGPGGEQAELYLADLRIEFIETKTDGLGGSYDYEWLSLSVDAPLGFEMGFDEVAGVLSPTITPPTGAQVTTRVQLNKIGADEPSVETSFSQLFPNFVSSLGEGFGAFPLPDFLGLQLQVLEVARHGNYFTLYASLDPTPQTRIEGVTVTDLSSADEATDSCCFNSWEWRHRIRKQISPTSVKVNYDATISSDACCTVDDGDMSANAGYRIGFNVVPENGDTWKIDLSHLINGAHTSNDEGYRGHSNISTVTGRYRIGAGAWVSFSFNPSDMAMSGAGPKYEPFTGSSATSFTGTTAQAITVEFTWSLSVRSDSNLAFPADDGDEVTIRLGANDSLTNGFTAGEYPGVGSRDIVADGHDGTVLLTTVP